MSGIIFCSDATLYSEEEVTVLIFWLASRLCPIGGRVLVYFCPHDRLADVLSFIDPELNGHYRNSRDIPACENPVKTKQIAFIYIPFVTVLSSILI